MTVDLVRELSGDVFKTVVIVAAPVLLVSLTVGLVISLFQAVTQIQEFTLTFVPKILAVFVTLYLFFPWIARVLITYTTDLITKIPVYIR
ncbi:MAG TPA: flagellar biosynthesis protein FliQ [Nitrospirota bacterium]|nr:flagellar biosynthesis protein FliQ [Nitrospirota bacterium]